MQKAESLLEPDTDPGRPQKSSSAFRTISEVADDLDVAQHVLRFWESKFPQVRPLKRGGGRRYYRPEDVEVLRQIRSLLYDQGYTIRGAQKLLRVKRTRAEPDAVEPAEAAPRPAAAPRRPAPRNGITPELREQLLGLRDQLQEMKALLRQARGASG